MTRIHRHTFTRHSPDESDYDVVQENDNITIICRNQGDFETIELQFDRYQAGGLVEALHEVLDSAEIQQERIPPMSPELQQERLRGISPGLNATLNAFTHALDAVPNGPMPYTEGTVSGSGGYGGISATSLRPGTIVNAPSSTGVGSITDF